MILLPFDLSMWRSDLSKNPSQSYEKQAVEIFQSLNVDEWTCDCLQWGIFIISKILRFLTKIGNKEQDELPGFPDVWSIGRAGNVSPALIKFIINIYIYRFFSFKNKFCFIYQHEKWIKNSQVSKNLTIGTKRERW